MKAFAPSKSSSSSSPQRSSSTTGAFFRTADSHQSQDSFFQTSLQVSQPGDKHEIEADRMADHVVGQPEQNSFFSSSSNADSAVQRSTESRPPEISRVAFESMRDDTPSAAPPEIQRSAAEPEAEAESKEEEEKDKSSEHTTLQRTPAAAGGVGSTYSSIRTSSGTPSGNQIQPSLGDTLSRQVRPGSSCAYHPRINPSRARGPPAVSSRFENLLQSSKGGGSPLGKNTRANMESAFGSDFSKVRVHNDARSHELNNSINAKAFAHGSNVYFAPNQYQPDSKSGQHLIAHELTHVVQQGQATPIQRKARGPPISNTSEPAIQRIPTSMEEVREDVNDLAENISGYSLATVIIGYNPILGKNVDWSASAFFRGAAGLLPGGVAIYDKLNEKGAIDNAFAWIEGKISEYDLTWRRVKSLWSQAWDEMGVTLGISGNVDVFKRTFKGFFGDVLSFISDCKAECTRILSELALTALREVIGDDGPAYDLMIMVLGKDPITEEVVEWVTVDFLTAAMDFFGFENERKKMEDTGKLQEAADWLDTQFGILKGAVTGLVQGVKDIWDTFSLETLASPLELLKRIFNVIKNFISKLLEFAGNVAIKVLELIKEALIALLKPHLDEIPGYPLLRVSLGKDPITGEVIPRTAENFVKGFLSFVPGGNETYKNLKKSGAIGKAMKWLTDTVNELGLSPAAIAETFLTLWNSFSIDDLMDPIPAFKRVGKTLLTFVTNVLTLVAKVGLKILEFVFIGVMGPAGGRVVAALKQGKNTFSKIIKNPVGFLGNLLKALGQGFNQFGKNIFKHLKKGLVGWLLGSMEGAGITLPEKFDMKGIFSFVAQILGLTYERFRPKLVKRLGEKAVAGLEKSFEFITLFLKEGFAGIWKKFLEYMSNLKETVIGGIRDFIITKIVTLAITKLATLSNPVGAVIEAIMAIYNVVMFFIERMEQILSVVESVIKSITNIANGKVTDAANFIETTMGRIVPVLISFLARLIGLGGISGKIKGIIKKIQKKVDKGIDKLLKWIVKKAKSLIKKGKAGLQKLMWWKKKETFTGTDKKPHTLFFKGSDEKAQLTVKSDPVTIEALINGALFEGKKLSPKQITRLKTEYKKLKGAIKKHSKSEKSNDKSITRHLNKIKLILGEGVGSRFYKPTGQSDDPILITWYKTEADYPTIAGKKPTQGVSIPYNGKTFDRKINASNFLKVGEEFTINNGPSTRNVPFFDKEQLEYFGSKDPNKGNHKVNTIDSEADYGPPSESIYQIDHVKDLRLGGADSYRNLWPLKASLNTAGNDTQHQKVITEYDDEFKTASLKTLNGKYVKAVKDSIDGAQQHAKSILFNRKQKGEPLTFDGTKENPYLIGWLKKKAQYPTLKPFGSNQVFSIGDKAYLEYDGKGKQVGNIYLHVDEKSHSPIGKEPWTIKNNTGSSGSKNLAKKEVAAKKRKARRTQTKVGSKMTELNNKTRNNKSVSRPQEVKEGNRILDRLDPSTYMEADHVRDLAMDGKDKIDNIWPLEKNKNNAANAVYNQFVAYSKSDEKGVRLQSIKNPTVKIHKVRTIPPSKGAHNTKEDSPSGYEALIKLSKSNSTQKKSRNSSDQNTPLEKEADSVADKVTKAPSSQTYAKVSEHTGQKLPSVNIHNNAESHQKAEALNARAFAKGNDVYFNKGEYAPETKKGQHLLAHELTHVAQQSGGRAPKSVQRNEDTESSAAPTNEYRVTSGRFAGTAYKVNSNPREIIISGRPLRVPSVKQRNSACYTRWASSSGGKLQVRRGSRGNTRQTSRWNREVRANVRTAMTDAENGIFAQATTAGSVDGNRYYLKLQNTDVMVFGTQRQLISRSLIPFWSKTNRPSSYQVDHIVEDQLRGETTGANGLDEAWNYELLEANANMASGRALDQEINGRISSAKNALTHEFTNLNTDGDPHALPSGRRLRSNYKIFFDSWNYNLSVSGGEPDNFYSLEDVKDNQVQLNSLTPVEQSDTDTLSEGKFLYVSKHGGSPISLPEDETQQVNHFLGTQVKLLSHDVAAGTLQVEAYNASGDNFVQNNSPQLTWRMSRDPFLNAYILNPRSVMGTIKNSLRLPGLSPIDLSVVDAENDGLHGSGKVLSDVPFLSEADIDIVIDGSSIRLRKLFELGELAIPPPFEIPSSSLEVFWGSDGLGVAGEAEFLVRNVGQGMIRAQVATGTGFSLAGHFDFDTDLFSRARIEVNYEDNEWRIGGEIGIDRGKITGVNSANATVLYDAGNLSATGNATLDVPGVEAVSINLNLPEAGGFTLGGDADLSSDIPGIESGSVGVTITKPADAEDYQVSARGTAVPSIPGINTSIEVAYENGALTIAGTVQYERGILSGELRIGATNRPVGEDGEPTDGAPTDSFSFYGNGTLTAQITDNLAGTIGVRFFPNAELEVSGRLEFTDSIEIFSQLGVPDAELFGLGFDIPIFAIPVGSRSVGLVATITGGLNAYGTLGPGELRDLNLGITYNPDRPDDTHITGGGRFVIPASAGLTLSVSAGIGLSAVIAGVEGGLELEGGLGLDAEASAGVEVDWTPNSGLEVSANLSAFIQPKLLFRINGYILAWLAWYETRWEWNLADYEYGPNFRFGLEMPITYRADEPFAPSFDDIELTYPTIDSSFLEGLIGDIQNERD